MPVSINGLSSGVYYPPNLSDPDPNPTDTAIKQFNAVLEANPEFLQFLQSANPQLNINQDSKGRSAPDLANQLLTDLGRAIYRDNNQGSLFQSQFMESLAASAMANKLYPISPSGGLTGLFPQLNEFLAEKATPKKKK